MKLKDYILALIITLLVISGLLIYQNTQRNESIHQVQVNTLKWRIKALENQTVALNKYKVVVDQCKAKVDDMTLSYYTLDQILKQMGLEAQKRYVR